MHIHPKMHRNWSPLADQTQVGLFPEPLSIEHSSVNITFAQSSKVQFFRSSAQARRAFA
jgi:hypothetical protein